MLAIAARQEGTARLGVAVVSALPASGAICALAQSGTGAVAAGGWVHPALARRILSLLEEEGLDAEEALARAMEGDAGRELRQMAVVGRSGAAAWTGEGVEGYCGHVVGTEYALIGGHLHSLDVLHAAQEAWESSPGHDLPERLWRSLKAGVKAGGDRRGHRSAAVWVVDRPGFPYADLRVEDHPHPLEELERLLSLTLPRRQGYEAWIRQVEAGEQPARPPQEEEEGEEGTADS
jgi:uncharacterized Ntn-hydrolase superfamily protein